MIDVEKGKVSELAQNPARGFRLSDWSEDGNWLVYYRYDDDSNSDVYFFDIQNKKENNVTQNPFGDYGGELTPDSKKLVFLSSRDDGNNHLFVLPLEKNKEDPDDPLVKEKNKNKKDKKKKGDKKDSEDKESTESKSKLILEMDRIKRRAVQITKGSNGVGSYFLSKDGKTVYFTSRDDKGSGLFSVSIDGKDKKKIVDGNFRRMSPTLDRKTLSKRCFGISKCRSIAIRKPIRL